MSAIVILGRPSPQRTLLEGLFSSGSVYTVTVLEDTAQLADCLSAAHPEVLLLGVSDGSPLWLSIVSLFCQHPSCRPPVVLTYSTGLHGRPCDSGDAALRCISQPGEWWEHCLMELLLALGFCSDTPGRRYIVCAMRLIAKDPNELTLLTKSLYGAVAKLLHTTPSAVEKAMRKQVRDTFYRGDAAAWERLFPESCARGHYPALGEFLKALHEALDFENAGTAVNCR